MDWREGRRRRAWELKKAGWKQKDIAVALGVSEGAVSHWMKRGREGGEAGLGKRPSPGRPPRLKAEQTARLEQILACGAEAYGFRGAVWTHPRLAAVISRELGIRYSPRQAGRLYKRLCWSRQKPAKRASQRNEQAILEWQTQTWPDVQKKP
jgi:transposase